ncbi:MAG: peptidoglycan DD-metalloendopeptidase family protein [Bacteroidetes bacterium]|nr:peptidoglycan DD-metalloendopeptidase family protein [Bacteroidota bacterium]
MSSFINYIIESTISISVFFIFYELFLKRDTWFRFNRYYLLFGLIFSFVIPFIGFSASGVGVDSQNQFQFNELIQMGSYVKSFEQNTLNKLPQINYYMLIYLVICGLFLVRLFVQFIKIYKTILANEIIHYKKFKIVFIQKESAPFSFFNYIFISKDDYGSIGSNELLLHEFVHARQKHSFDVIFLELLLVLQWFNPFIYRYRLAFKEVHEYLADRGVLVKQTDRTAYQKLILDQIEKGFQINLASHFNYSLTKNRIKMMTRINSSKKAYVKILFVLPLVLVLLSAFTIETAKESVVEKSGFNFMIDQSTKVPSLFPVKKIEGVKISSGFGMRMHPIKKEKMMHNAVDIKAPQGTPVYAAADGMVRKVKQNHKEGTGYGRYIIIDHEEGFSTLYAQLAGYNVKEGEEVNKGEIIGYVGSSGMSTGSHLHYEVMKDGENVNPEKYF